GILLAVLQRRITLFHAFFLGGLLVWVGIVASAFVPNMACMTVTFGLIHGLGYGLTITTLSVLLAMYFYRYRGLASGIKYVGMSCSGLVFPKLLAYLRRQYGFRGTLLIYGGIATHVTAFGLLLKEPPWICLTHEVKEEKLPTVRTITKLRCQLTNVAQHKNAPTNSTRKHWGRFSSLLTILRQPIFYLIVSCAMIVYLSSPVFTSTVMDYAVDKGLSLSDGETLVVYGSCTQIVGRLFVPPLADVGWIRRGTLAMTNFLIAGVSMLLMPHATLHAHVLLVCLFVYLSLGCLSTLKSVLMADYLGVEWISTCYGASGLLLLPMTFCSSSIIG
ncbi:unnamed protein product, partial [Ixodes hexagonus]